MSDRQLIADLLSALEYHTEQTRPIEFSKVAIEAAREYLSKPAQQQEPVAYLYHDARTPKDAHPWLHSTMLVLAAERRPGLRGETPLYTSPPAQRKPLTDEQIWDEVKAADLDWQTGWSLDEDASNRYSTFARAIEAAHGIKENT